ncbi:MAG: hypothetical protein KAT00_01535 [Planctomycetes bacterium]|nr:hypothetical protein [Planctomycetota bacterium]
MKAIETITQKTSVLMVIEAKFRCSVGLWYGETEQAWSNTMVIPASTIGQAVTGLVNDGNTPALLNVRIVPHDSLTVNDCAIEVKGISQWEFGGNFAADDEQLFVLASLYKCVTNDIIAQRDAEAIALGLCSGVWGDGSYLYAANGTDGIHSYSIILSTLLHVDSDDQGDSALGVWGDGKFVYLANGGGGIHSYSVSSAGVFTHIDFDDQGDIAKRIWGDGKFIYLANGVGGIHSYSVDDAGVFTHVDFDDQGDNATDVWGDGRFIYLANDTGGIHTYSVSDAGILTHIDSDDQGGTALGVWGDGKFVYLANGLNGIHSYSVSDAGILTYIDSDDQGFTATKVWGDGEFIYLANNGTLCVYSVNSVGEFTYLDSVSPAGAELDVWGDGTWVFAANSTFLYVFQTNSETNAYASLDIGEGNLLGQPDIDQVAWLWLPPGTHLTRVKVDCSAGGAAQEVDVFVTWWDTYV